MTAHVLIVRFSSIGDIVMTTPVIRAVKRQCNGGDVEVHFLTKRGYLPLLAANPCIDRLHAIERKVGEVLPQLRSIPFDWVVDLHNNPRSFQVRRGLGCPAQVVRKGTARRWLNIHLGLDVLPPGHMVDRFMATVAPLGIQNDGLGLDFFLRPEDEVDPELLPRRHREQGYVAWVIGGQHGGKLYPAKWVAQACRELGQPVVLLGGPEDRVRGAQIAAQGGEGVFDACGATSFNQAAALVRDAVCVVSNDTGLMHVAAAFKKRVVSLWGATVPAFGMSPYLPGEGSLVLEAQCPGRPYSKHGGKLPLRAPYTCWDGLEPAKVVAAVQGG